MGIVSFSSVHPGQSNTEAETDIIFNPAKLPEPAPRNVAGNVRIKSQFQSNNCFKRPFFSKPRVS
jgi:hypothetical protein